MAFYNVYTCVQEISIIEETALPPMEVPVWPMTVPDVIKVVLPHGKMGELTLTNDMTAANVLDTICEVHLK